MDLGVGREGWKWVVGGQGFRCRRVDVDLDGQTDWVEKGWMLG